MFVFLVLFLSHPILAHAQGEDPFQWLEKLNSKRSQTWVQSQNSRTLKDLEGHPLFEGLYSDALEVASQGAHGPMPVFGTGYFRRFLQNAQHPRGVQQRTTFEEYQKPEPQWETLYDLDQLSLEEGKNWTLRGGAYLDGRASRLLLFLSEGGKLAFEVREYDERTKAFVKGGFTIDEGAVQVTVVDQDHLLVSTDFGPDSFTDGDYPRLIKFWTRGQRLQDAPTVFEIQKSDLSISSRVLADGGKIYWIFTRSIDFFHHEFFVHRSTKSPLKIPVPTSSKLLNLTDGFFYFQLTEPVTLDGQEFKGNSIIRNKIEAPDLREAEVIYTGQPHEVIESVAVLKDRVVIGVFDKIASKVLDVRRGFWGQWKVNRLPFPQQGNLDFTLLNTPSFEGSLLNHYDHLSPARQFLIHDEDESYRMELLKQAPELFESSPFESIQKFAVSRDGTRVPYFILQSKNLALDGSHPTVLYGYGGFNVSLKPKYEPEIGKLWLERGGVYVIANIRGGGELGPDWHRAALKENRQRSFDDFIAVAEDLIAQKITSPHHLGIKGGSNGGLLVGATMVQRPDLFHAAVMQVPVLDMVRYAKLGIGDAWIAEYGDPKIASQCAYLLGYSPYHNLMAGKSYPHALFMTSTQDDVVHPAHARKMAARMQALGQPFYFWEAAEGGHYGTGQPKDRARERALEYTYLWNLLR